MVTGADGVCTESEVRACADGGSAEGVGAVVSGIASLASLPTPPTTHPSMAVRLQQAGEALILAASLLNSA